ncbi:MAG: S-adenosylmethionine decarboxylase [Chloroflexi bacterium]|nr:S-adenosylmethionine decarboxylase [Chloroflexota bacterium]
MHLIIDGFGADPARLRDFAFIYRFLDTCPERIGMNKISCPHVIEYTQCAEEDWGLSGFVFIAESHISVHTYPARCYVNIDVFSCKPFDTGPVAREIEQEFALERAETWVVDRGAYRHHAAPTGVAQEAPA